MSAFLLVLLVPGGGCGRAALGVSSHRDAAHTQSGSPTVDASGTSQPSVGGQCPDGFSACGKGDGLRCYDLSRSKDHCGVCGSACAPGISCQAGTCQQYRCKGALGFKSLATSTGDALTLGDFDGDGILDIVAGSEAGGPMTLRFGVGDGTFLAHQIIDATPIDPGTGWQPGSQARAADLDGDSFADLASISGGDRSKVTVRRGSGSRNAPFGEPTDYPTTSNALSGLLLADFDADGRLDLAVGASKGLEFWRGQDGGRFEPQAPLDSPDMDSSFSGIPLAMDWNGDRVLDLVYGNFGFGGYGFPAIGGSGNLFFRLGRGDSSFDPEVACALIPGIVGDLDHDNRPDLISGSTLLLGIDGCHASKIVQLSDWPKQGGIALADFNGDGNLDVVADYDKKITVRVGDGQGGFAQSLSMSAYQAGQWPLGILLDGDLNRDGKLDIVFARDGKWGVFLNTCQ
jgi:hypothetical protein